MFEVAFNFDHHQQDPEEQDTEIVHLPSSTSNNEIIQINDQTREDQAQKQLIDFKVVELNEKSENADHDQNVEHQISTNIKQTGTNLSKASFNSLEMLESTKAPNSEENQSDKIQRPEKSSAIVNQQLVLNRRKSKTRDSTSTYRTQDSAAAIPIQIIKSTIHSSDSKNQHATYPEAVHTKQQQTAKMPKTLTFDADKMHKHIHIQHLKQNQTPMETIKDNDAMIQCTKPALNFNLKTEQSTPPENSSLLSSFGKTKQNRKSSPPKQQKQKQTANINETTSPSSKLVRANDDELQILQDKQASAIIKANVEEDNVVQCGPIQPSAPFSFNSSEMNTSTETPIQEENQSDKVERSEKSSAQQLALNRSESKTGNSTSKTQDVPMPTIKTKIHSSESKHQQAEHPEERQTAMMPKTLTFDSDKMHKNIQVLEQNQAAMVTTINRVKENDAIL
jgi:hypothetical protein